MDFSDDELNEIEEFAALAFSVADIAIIMQKDINDMHAEFSKPESKLRQRYQAGFLMLQADLRKSIKESAIHGSNPAQQLMQKYIELSQNTNENA